MNDLKKTVIAFICTLAVEAILVWTFLLLNGTLLEALRAIIVLAATAIIGVLLLLWWLVTHWPSRDFHDDRSIDHEQ